MHVSTRLTSMPNFSLLGQKVWGNVCDQRTEQAIKHYPQCLATKLQKSLLFFNPWFRWTWFCCDALYSFISVQGTSHSRKVHFCCTGLLYHGWGYVLGTRSHPGEANLTAWASRQVLRSLYSISSMFINRTAAATPWHRLRVQPCVTACNRCSMAERQKTLNCLRLCFIPKLHPKNAPLCCIH